MLLLGMLVSIACVRCVILVKACGMGNTADNLNLDTATF